MPARGCFGSEFELPNLQIDRHTFMRSRHRAKVPTIENEMHQELSSGEQLACCLLVPSPSRPSGGLSVSFGQLDGLARQTVNLVGDARQHIGHHRKLAPVFTGTGRHDLGVETHDLGLSRNGVDA